MPAPFAVPLFGLFCFAILTLWVSAYWPVAVFQVGIFILSGAAVWHARRVSIPFAWPFIPLSFAVLWGLFQLFTLRTVYAFETRVAILRWATLLCVFLMGVSLFRDDGLRRRFQSAMVWFAFAVAVLATVQSFTSNGTVFWLFATPYTDFVMGPFLYRNHFAAFIEAVLPIAVYRAIDRERNSLLYSMMAAAMYASVIASASRAGTVLATAEIFLVPLLLWVLGRSPGRDVAAGLLRMGVILAIFTAVVGWESVWMRLWTPDPLGLRRQFALSTVDIIRSHPWFGTGLGTWPTVYPQYATVDVGLFANQAHDDWLQWTAEGGLPFGIMLTTLFFWCLPRAFKSIWGLGILAFFLHAVVDYPFSRPALGCWAILIVSMLAAESKHSGKERTRSHKVDQEMAGLVR